MSTTSLWDLMSMVRFACGKWKLSDLTIRYCNINPWSHGATSRQVVVGHLYIGLFWGNPKNDCCNMKQDKFSPYKVKKGLTVHRKENGRTRLLLDASGSARVNEFPPRTGLELLPKLQDPDEVTLLWYSLRHMVNSVLHCTGQTEVGSVRGAPPQHEPSATCPRKLLISSTCSSNIPDPDTTWNNQTNCQLAVFCPSSYWRLTFSL